MAARDVTAVRRRELPGMIIIHAGISSGAAAALYRISPPGRPTPLPMKIEGHADLTVRPSFLCTDHVRIAFFGIFQQSGVIILTKILHFILRERRQKEPKLFYRPEKYNERLSAQKIKRRDDQNEKNDQKSS